MTGIGSHQSARRLSDDWLTPPWLLEQLGEFDLDPCCPPSMPWRTAKRMLTLDDDGLHADWSGRVWLNPPYSEILPWVAKLARHGHGMLLVFARTDTSWFQDHVFPEASALLFLRGRLFFHRADGARAPANAGGPTVLAAYGGADADALRSVDHLGCLVEL